jgi:peptidoglycan/LPS O-acetylase OafA/YrhL
MTNSNHKVRLIELDILRILAILLIIYVHSSDYIYKISILEWLRDGGRYLGLGLFVFLSGFGLQYSIINKDFDIISFLKKRIIKLYPLYIFSLFLYIILFHYLQIYHTSWDFSPIYQTAFLHIFSLQVLFSPIYPTIYTLWFIGMIIPLYFIFVLTAKINNTKFIKYNIYILLFLIIIRILFNIIDLRFFLYYSIFIIGVLYARNSIIDKLILFLNDKNNIKKAIFYTILLVFLSIIIYWFYKYFVSIPIPIKKFNITIHLKSYIAIFIYSILSINSLILIVFLLNKLWANKIEYLSNFIKNVSNICYPVYLLHRVVYAIFYFIILNKLHFSIKVGTLLFPLFTLFLFLISGIISYFEKITIDWFSVKIKPKLKYLI